MKKQNVFILTGKKKRQAQGLKYNQKDIYYYDFDCLPHFIYFQCSEMLLILLLVIIRLVQSLQQQQQQEKKCLIFANI